MPENTTHRDPGVHLLGAMSEGLGGYIGGMEADGQRQLVASASLPTDTRGADAEFLALGFTFAEPDGRDPMFRDATLPQGWRKEGSDHAMWSYVLDELGRRRVAIFYKAAYYDRSASMRLETVYGYAAKLAYDDAMPAFDDTWCTREAFAEVISARQKEIVERVELYESRLGDERVSWAAEGLTEAKADLAKHVAWATKAVAA
jgi:hypothetical protein